MATRPEEPHTQPTQRQQEIDKVVSAVNTWISDQDLPMGQMLDHPALVAAMTLSAEASVRAKLESQLKNLRSSLQDAYVLYRRTGDYILLTEVARRISDG